MHKRLHFFFVLSSITSLTVACSDGSGDNGGGDGGKTTLTFWNMPFVTGEVSAAYVSQWEADVQEALPNYTIDSNYGPGTYTDQRDRYLDESTTGTPDVIEGLLEDTGAYVSQGLIEPLDDMFAAWDEKDQFVASTLTPLTADNKLYGISYNTNARAMVYRKDIFEKYSLTVPTTWQELIDTARQITQLTAEDGEVDDMYGVFVCTDPEGPRSPQEFISWYYQVSDKQPMFTVTNSGIEFNATEAQLQKVLELYDSLYEDVQYPAVDRDQVGTGWPVEDPGYLAGKWAMAPMGPWLWGGRENSATAKQILEEKTGIAPLPVADGGTPATYLEVKSIMLNGASAHKDEAWELIKFITSKEKMAEWMADSGGIPARSDAMEMDVLTQSDIGWWIQGFADELEKSVAMAPINWSVVNTANLMAVVDVIEDTKTPAEAATDLHATITQKLADGELD